MPKFLLPEEWGLLFLKHLVKKQAVKGKYREVSVEDLTKQAEIFAMAMKIKFPRSGITSADVLDVVQNKGWVVPSAGGTFVINERFG